jgi:hypothetical protein
MVNGPAFSATKTGSDQSVTSNTITKATLNTVDFDTASCFSDSTFTPNVAGYYQINGTVYATGTSVTNVAVFIYKNGAMQGVSAGPVTGNYVRTTSVLLYCNGSTDYIELYGRVTASSASAIAASGGTTLTRMSGALVRGA